LGHFIKRERSRLRKMGFTLFNDELIIMSQRISDSH
jgi:hypothetical protein